MASNDDILFESNFENWKQDRTVDLEGVDLFSFYTLDQFLKPFDVTDEEILDGIVDGGNDGGLDAAYLFLNGTLLTSDTDVDAKSKRKEIQFFFHQGKDSRKGFSYLEINKFREFCDDFFDLSINASDLEYKYNERLLDFIALFKNKAREMLTGFPEVSVKYIYVTRTDTLPDTKARAALTKVQKLIEKHLSGVDCDLRCINLRALLEQVKVRPIRDKVLQWSEQPIGTREGFVGLVKLPDYFGFLTDDKGNLIERMHDSNVRGYQQDTTVNSAIARTLKHPEGINFWELNNGITILATNRQTVDHRTITLEDPKIVNGLQTSREIYKHFSSGGSMEDTRTILVRIIVTDDAHIQDAVIRATNSQNKLPPFTLRGTDEIQEKIEELFKSKGLYYDRRKGFYKDKGMPVAKIVSLSYLTQSMLTLKLRLPNEARSSPSEYLTDDARYELIFNETFPIEVYLTSVNLVQLVDQTLRRDYDLKGTQRSNVMFYIALVLACRLTRSAEPTVSELAKLKTRQITDGMFNLAFEKVWNIYENLGGDDKTAKSSEMTKRVKTYIKRSLSASTGHKSKSIVKDDRKS